MNIDDVTNIDELAEYMTAEAALWGRDKVTKQKTVNGEGIRQQWEERETCPYPVFYLMSGDVVTDDIVEFDDPPAGTLRRPRVRFELKAMWFNEDGDVTDRPEDE